MSAVLRQRCSWESATRLTSATSPELLESLVDSLKGFHEALLLYQLLDLENFDFENDLRVTACAERPQVSQVRFGSGEVIPDVCQCSSWAQVYRRTYRCVERLNEIAVANAFNRCSCLSNPFTADAWSPSCARAPLKLPLRAVMSARRQVARTSSPFGQCLRCTLFTSSIASVAGLVCPTKEPSIAFPLLRETDLPSRWLEALSKSKLAGVKLRKS